MQKRIIEAVAILAVLAAGIIAVNFVLEALDQNPIAYQIDGRYYSVSDGSAELALITEDGLENLQKLTRMTELTITPYKYQRFIAVNAETPEEEELLRKRIEYSFGDYTDVTDISFLENMTWIEKLSIEGCAVNDISALSGMTGLTELSLCNTLVSNLSVLQCFPQLETLNIAYIPAEDYSVLGELPSLKTVYLSKDQYMNYFFTDEQLAELAHSITIQYVDSEEGEDDQEAAE